MSSSSKEKLQEAFQIGLGLPPKTDFDQLTFNAHPKWDSVAHMQLINSIENAFDVMLETNDIVAVNNFSAAVEMLKKYGVTFGD